MIKIIPSNYIDTKILEFLQYELQVMFNSEVRILETVEIPKRFLSTKRVQYSADKILDHLIKRFDINRSNDVYLAVFDKDIYSRSLNFVFGLASWRPKACLISIIRLRQSFYGKEEKYKKENKGLFYLRIKKEAVHEIGHTLSLVHCQDPYCVMYFSNCLADTDNKSADFCNKCIDIIVTSMRKGKV